jgi:hypothetical protein
MINQNQPSPASNQPSPQGEDVIVKRFSATDASVSVVETPKETLVPEEKKPEQSIGVLEKKEKDSRSAADLVAPTAKKKSFSKRISDAMNNFGLGKEKAHFIENLAILLNSGLSVVDALKTIIMEIRVNR